jgi:putative ABC transport system permease protein
VKPGTDFRYFIESPCGWIDFWVELPTAADAQRYRQFLEAYGAEQHLTGRFTRKPPIKMWDVRSILVELKAVPDEYRAAGIAGLGFLLVCLANAVALMLARFTRRSSELAVRRALGANRAALFAQCFMETGLIGVLGGICGLLLTQAGLIAERAALPPGLAGIARLDGALALITVGVATMATLCAGLYPVWHASRVNSTALLKAQ